MILPRNAAFPTQKIIYVPSYDRALIADSGFVVSLFAPREVAHKAAVSFLATNEAPIITIQGVITEACFFLSVKGRRALLEWISRGAISLMDVPAPAYADIAAIVTRYQNLDPDFVDCALVWLAGEVKCRRILTLDKRDFGTFRIKGNKRFDMIEWQT
jgi:uncharacterized protein